MSSFNKEYVARASSTPSQPVFEESLSPSRSLAPWSEPAFHSSPSPYYNETHSRYQRELRSYIDTNILPHQLDWETAGDLPQSVRLAWAKSGFAFTDIPSAYRPRDLPGPAGIPRDDLDVFHLLLSVDETSRIEGGVTTALSGASVIGVPPIIHHGTPEQKQNWLPGLFNWQTCFCLGVTEPGAGSDVASITTTAEKTSDGTHYIVNGAKKWITGIPWATHMTTAVRTGPPSSGRAGISVLVIPLSTPGLTHHRLHNSGQKAGGASLVDLSDVRVPVSNLIGAENQGFKILMQNFNRERFIMAVGCNRKSRTCLSHALAYALTRKTFNKPLIANQIIAEKFARMARYVESHWAWLEAIAFKVQNGAQGKGFEDEAVAGEIALAKVHGGRILEMCHREAQQVFGGKGYERGSGAGAGGAVVEQIGRDLRMMVVGGGSEEIIADLAVRQEVGAAKRRGWKL